MEYNMQILSGIVHYLKVLKLQKIYPIFCKLCDTGPGKKTDYYRYNVTGIN